MRYIINPHSDPAFNLATEEYLLKNTSGEFFILGRNARSVIVGKHQNALSEINALFLNANNIPVYRRISGGGTVYHDPGNLNFTFITNGEEGKMVSFRKHTRPVIEFFQEAGLDVKFEGLNNLTLKGLKFSGNAEHIHKNRVLHHGTILYNSDLTCLKEAIKTGTAVYIDKSVKSIRSKVTNISAHLADPVDISAFMEMIIDHVRNTFPGSVQYHLSEYDTGKILKLKHEKYDTWEWNFGYSPPYVFRNSIKVSGNTFSVYISVNDGIIKEIEFTVDHPVSEDVEGLQLALIGQRHHIEIVSEIFKLRNAENHFPGLSRDELVRLMF